jgi:hypothetical protein
VPRQRPNPPAAAELTVPSWMWGGAAARFFSDAGLDAEPVDPETGRWRVWSREPRTPLVTADDLAGPRIAPERWSLLAEAAGQNFLVDDRGGQVQEHLRRRTEKAATTQAPVDAFAAWQLLTLDAPPEQLPTVANAVWSGLRAMRTDGEPPKPVFAAAGVHLLRRSPQLMHRARMASFWLRITYDDVLAQGTLDHLTAANAAGDHVFASADGLYDGIVLFDVYTGPLLGALTPAIWGFPVHRALGVLIYSLGQPLAGTPGDATELLHLLPTQGATRATAVPRLPETAAAVAISWWAQRLDEMFAVLTDPAVFTDMRGTYRPEKHLQALLTVEQLFRRVSSTQTVHRDTNARRVLLFTVLDTLWRLTGPEIEELCSLARARNTLQKLRERVPHAAAAVLLPAAEEAVRALEQLQTGFFISRQLGREVVAIPRAHAPEHLTLDTAAARYVKVLRDATHGHGTRYPNKAEQANALLAQHHGHLPHELGLLGYLYLLEFLLEPARLRTKLYRGGQT